MYNSLMKKYQIQKGIVCQKLEEKTVIFDNEKSYLYNLNETASYIFLQLKKSSDEKKIRELMVKRYDVTVKQAQKDVTSLISQLLRMGVIRKV